MPTPPTPAPGGPPSGHRADYRADHRAGHRADHRPPGDGLLRLGVGVTVVGLVCTLVAILPLVLPSLRLPSVFWFLAMLTAVGLLLVVLGLLRAARARGRRVVAQVDRLR